MRRLLLVLALYVGTALAADVAGTWKGTAETPNGTMERTFVFQVDGTKLTGETTSEMLGKSTITDGKVEGDAISFTITVNFQGEERKIQYKGKIAGTELKLSADLGDIGTIEYTAKKVS